MAGRRGKRDPHKEAPAFNPQPDDWELLTCLLRRRLLNTKQIQRLFPHRSKDRISRRLDTFCLNQWIEIPENFKLLRRAASGSIPNIYALGSAGARALKEERGDALWIPRRDWKRDNAKMRPAKMQEIIDVSEFMVDVERSVACHEALSVLDTYDLNSYRKKHLKRGSTPRTALVPVVYRGVKSRRALVPDELIELHWANRLDPDRRSGLFTVELDNETETIVPSREVREDARFWNSSSIYKKNVIYINAFRQNSRLFGRATFRVLYITKTEGHMEEMIQSERDHFSRSSGKQLWVPPGFFLYTNQERIAAHKDDVLAMPWLARSGKEWRLHE